MQAWIDELSGSVAKVSTFQGLTAGGTATGFFYKRLDEFFFVTNWHVVTGRNPDNPALSRDGRFVTKIIVSYVALTEEQKIRIYSDTIEINDSEGRGLNWFQHPLESKVDIAVVKWQFPPTISPWILNSFEIFDRIVCYVGDNIYVLGYPWGIARTANQLQIWKSGTIATIPGVNYNGFPRFLIDARTFKGMSGSTVICIEQISFSGNRIRDFQKGKDPIAGKLAYFCGVYSGRLYAPNSNHEQKLIETDLGYVWLRETMTSGQFHCFSA